MRILLLDIETAPNLAYVWGLFKQNVAISQIDAASYTLCWAAKWLGEDELMFDSVKKSGHRKMLVRLHKLLDKADAVIHYNGVKFDIPTINKEFVKSGITPPSPYKNIDVFLFCKKKFRFESNKLDWVAKSLGLGEKVKHEGFELWVQCMAGNADAWTKMEEYNRGDVTLLEKVYNKLLPWMDTHPNRVTYTGIDGCPNCGSEAIQARGYAITRVSQYKRFQCTGCGHWFRGHKAVATNNTMKQIAA